MDRIFFYTNAKIFDLTTGITKKINSQVKAFKDLGFEVEYSAYTEDGVAIFNDKGQVISSKKYRIKNKKIQRIIRRTHLLKFCSEYLKRNKNSFKLIYARYHFFDSRYIQFLKNAKLASEYVVIEAHSYPVYQKELSIMTPVYIADYIWAKKAKKFVDFVAAMNNMDRIWDIPTVKIFNSIDVEAVSIHKPKVQKNTDKEIHLISVAYESKVHGLDRIIKSIDLYKQSGGEWDFVVHFVGTHLDSTRTLAQESPFKEYYNFYNPVSGKELDEMYNRADIGIGSIANHRIGSYYGSALKTIEYLAKGLPFIYGWREKIIDDDYPYAIRVELNEEPINMESIIHLYENTRLEENLQNKIRSQVATKYTWLEQMKRIIKKMDKI